MLTKSDISIVLFLVALLNLGLGIFVLMKAPRRKPNVLFFFIASVLATWSACHAMTLRSDDIGVVLFWTRMIMVGPIFLPFIFIWFANVMVTKGYQLTQRTLLLHGGFIIFFLCQMFGPDMVKEISIAQWGNIWKAGWAYKAWSIYFAVFMSYGLYCLFRGIRTSKGNHKKQLTYVCIGTAIPFVIGLVANIGLVMVGIYEFNKYGPIGTLVMVSFFAYAIVRYQLMDVRIFLRRAGLLVFLYTILLAVGAPIIILFGRHAAGLEKIHITPFVLSVVLLSVILSIAPFLYAAIVRESSYFREDTVAGLTHELKSPLASIESAVGVILDLENELSKRPEKIREYAEMIHRNVGRLNEYVNDLLQVFRCQNGKPQLSSNDVNVRDICDDVLGQYQETLKAKKIKTKASFVDAAVSCDPGRIRQVFSNIVSNAIKFTDHGEIAMAIEKNTSEVKVSVKDDGKGISSTDLPYIFDRFYQAHPAKTAKGSGIGLTIAKAWVEAHGGKIWAESEGEGKGTTVTFTLPV